MLNKEGDRCVELGVREECSDVLPWMLDESDAYCVQMCPASTYADPEKMMCRFEDYCDRSWDDAA